jgi:amphi-Trp domain-containing protein
VSDLKVERKESLTRAEAGKRLAQFAEALTRGSEVELNWGGTSLELRVGADVRTEFEVKVSGDVIEVEIEMTWSTASESAAEPGEKV